jgi:general L-amino acid transport system permease protein
MANAEVFVPIASRAPPTRSSGPVQWVRTHLFGGWGNTLATLVIVGLALLAIPAGLKWAVINAVFAPDNAACRAAHEHGACWGVITEKYRLILFGRYPFEEQWRPLVACLVMMGLIAASCWRAFWKPWLLALWVLGLAAFFMLMFGGTLGMTPVETSRWGGFPLTLMLSTLSLVMAFPLAVLVALGRTSKLPGIRTVCVLYVELIRGVPLISVLFMASFMFPLFMPQGMTIDVLVRVMVGMTLFSAAYLAEVVRGGLQALPKGQLEAAQSLGLGYWQATRMIVLPQALRMVVPAIMNMKPSFISTCMPCSRSDGGRPSMKRVGGSTMWPSALNTNFDI